jgi:hypothetical protein
VTHTSLIAVDLVLLLPPLLIRSIVKLNRRLKSPPEGFLFDSDHLPHLTLVQQFVRETDLAALDSLIKKRIHHHLPLQLHTTQLSSPRTACTLGVTLSRELMTFHCQLMSDLLPFFVTTNVQNAVWAVPDIPRPADVQWVSKFRQDSAFDQFNPHITVGIGTVEACVEPRSFVAATVALCHLGRFCTCRRVLKTWELTTRKS